MKRNYLFLIFIFLTITFVFSQTSDLQVQLDEFKQYIIEMKEAWNIPGMAVGIVEDDEVIFMETFGTLSEKGEIPVNEHTTFQIGSTSKAFTATLMAMLEESGEISWDDRVRDHYPEFQMADPWVSENMRLHDLMAQHSGMYPYVGDMAVIFGFGRDYILDKLKYMEPLYQFRKDFTYVNTLFLVSEVILEDKHGKTFGEIMHDKIFNPLSMNDTTISYKDHLQRKNKTITHVFTIEDVDGKNEIVVSPLNPLEKQFEWSYIYAPAGGIDSSISDMVKWLSLNMNHGKYQEKRLISEEALAFLYKPTTILTASNEGDLFAYCQGWVYQDFLSYPMYWHNGSTIGSKTMIAFIPKLDIGIVVLSNLGDTNLPDDLAKDFFESYITDQLGNRAKTDLDAMLNSTENEEKYTPEQYSDPQELSSYTGTYHNNLYGTVTVEANEDKLVMYMGPLDDPFTLQHLNRDSFNVLYNRCGITSIGVATFKIDIYGEAESFSIDSFASEGTGDFKRMEENE